MKKQLLIVFIIMLYSVVLQAQTVYEVSDFAGSGVNGSANGVGTAASFNYPVGITIDASGNLYVCDYLNHKIRKITLGGVVTDFAGSGVKGSTNGVGTAASFNYPVGITIDASGNLYVGDGENNKIRKITPGGVVTDFAGNGKAGSANGVGTAASFFYPSAIAIDASGNLYVCDYLNHKIRKITPGGVVSDFAGSGVKGSANGVGTAASFNGPFAITIDASGNLYVCDISNHKIRKITPGGVVTDFAGSGIIGSANGVGTAANFYRPIGITIDDSGNLYVCEGSNNKIRKITPGGVVTDFAGSGVEGSANGVGTAASFNFPNAITIDASGNFYVSDYNSHRVRKITPTVLAPSAVYYDVPSSVCLGSTLNKNPDVSGSEVKLNLNHNAITTNPIIDICKGGNNTFFVLYEGDSIIQYNSLGVKIMRYDQSALLSNIRAIAADTFNRVYAWSDGINSDAIHRIKADGSVEFAGFLTTSSSFTNVTSMEVGPGGLYVADNTNGYIALVDTSTSGISVYHTVQNIKTISFGRDAMYIFDNTTEKVYVNDLTTAVSFSEMPLGLDTLNLDLDGFEYDTTGLMGVESFFVSSSTNNKIYRCIDFGNGFDLRLNTPSMLEYTSLIAVNQPIATVCLSSGTDEVVWVATGDDQLEALAIYSYKISPTLPRGLVFDILTGKVKGTPYVSSPATTYTVEINSDLFGTSTHTFNFSVNATGPINNSTGTAISKNEQSDGLKVNYFDINNCAEIMAIEDEKGGTSIGNVEVKQEVLPTLASFASGNFVRRVTEVNTQNPTAEARIKLYFTNDDINHYNSLNGVDPDLDNSLPGPMQVAILQLHKGDNGVTEQIKHSPIDATWDATKSLWVVDFEITKFSTFYMGESSTINSFDCSTTGLTETKTSCGFYVWRGKAYTQTGTYKDTTANQHGCDSILTLNLTITNDIEITPDAFFPENLYCNTTDADSYQWLNCDDGGIVIDGETDYYYVPTYNGSYSVIVTKNSCTDTSLCVTVTGLLSPPTTTGVEKAEPTSSIVIAPNPSTGKYTITGVEDYAIKVFSTMGAVVHEEENSDKEITIDLSAYTNGIYYVKISSPTSSKIMKLLKY